MIWGPRRSPASVLLIIPVLGRWGWDPQDKLDQEPPLVTEWGGIKEDTSVYFWTHIHTQVCARLCTYTCMNPSHTCTHMYIEAIHIHIRSGVGDVAWWMECVFTMEFHVQCGGAYF